MQSKFEHVNLEIKLKIYCYLNVIISAIIMRLIVFTSLFVVFLILFKVISSSNTTGDFNIHFFSNSFKSDLKKKNLNLFRVKQSVIQIHPD